MSELGSRVGNYKQVVPRHAFRVEFWAFSKLSSPSSSSKRQEFSSLSLSNHKRPPELLGASLSIRAQNERIKRSSLKCTQMSVPLSTLEQYHEERDAGRICDPGGITDSHPSKYPLPLRKWGERSCRLPAKPNLIESSSLVPFRRTCKGPLKARGKEASSTSSARALLPAE